LIAIANQLNGAAAGFIQPAVYAAKNRNAFFDTTIGGNGSFSAGPGWDACTGLGSPLAPRLINAVRPASSGTRSGKRRRSAASPLSVLTSLGSPSCRGVKATDEPRGRTRCSAATHPRRGLPCVNEDPVAQDTNSLGDVPLGRRTTEK